MSLRQIAQNLGLSVTTVSRALGGYSDVSEPTRQRIEAEAERIGYIPNEMARRLQKGRADAIGFVIPGGPEAFDDPYFLKIISGAWSRLEDHDLDLLVLSAPVGPKELKIYRRLVEGRRVDGLIVTRVLPDDQRLDYLQRMKFPFVTVGAGQFATKGVVSIDIDSRKALHDALTCLTELGHRRIAIGGPHSVAFSRARIEFFRELAKPFGITPTEVVDDNSIDGGDRIVRRLKDMHPEVTALITTSDRVGAGALRAMRDLGLTPAQDLSLISFGDSTWTALADPPISALRLPTEDLAAHAVDVLLKLREGIPVGPMPVWTAKLNLRKTHGPAPDVAETGPFAAVGRSKPQVGVASN